ncbi:MAG: ester cyclase [Candidatus Aminicenantaceae bacterium]
MKKLLVVIPLVFLLCFAFACQDKAAMAELEAMKTQAAAEEQNKADLKKLAEKYQEAFDNQDMAALAQLYAEDATLIYSGEPEPIQGREAIERSLAAMFRAMPDFSVEFTLILISGNYIVFEAVSQGTFTGPLASPEGDIPPTGKSVKNKVAFIAKVNADGLIEEDRTYYDSADFMRQLGLIE